MLRAGSTYCIVMRVGIEARVLIDGEDDLLEFHLPLVRMEAPTLGAPARLQAAGVIGAK